MGPATNSAEMPKCQNAEILFDIILALLGMLWATILEFFDEFLTIFIFDMLRRDPITKASEKEGLPITRSAQK